MWQTRWATQSLNIVCVVIWQDNLLVPAFLIRASSNPIRALRSLPAFQSAPSHERGKKFPHFYIDKPDSLLDASPAFAFNAPRLAPGGTDGVPVASPQEGGTFRLLDGPLTGARGWRIGGEMASTSMVLGATGIVSNWTLIVLRLFMQIHTKIEINEYS